MFNYSTPLWFEQATFVMLRDRLYERLLPRSWDPLVPTVGLEVTVLMDLLNCYSSQNSLVFYIVIYEIRKRGQHAVTAEFG
jgi:hypothetical protein